MSEYDPWVAMPPEERRKLLDQNHLMEIKQDIFHETLEIAERIWTGHALLLIQGGATPETAISICADACALEHRNMRARWTFEALSGLELHGTRRSISTSEAAVDVVEALIKSSEPSTTPALGRVWKDRFTQRVRSEINRHSGS